MRLSQHMPREQQAVSKNTKNEATRDYQELDIPHTCTFAPASCGQVRFHQKSTPKGLFLTTRPFRVWKNHLSSLHTYDLLDIHFSVLPTAVLFVRYPLFRFTYCIRSNLLDVHFSVAQQLGAVRAPDVTLDRYTLTTAMLHSRPLTVEHRVVK